MISEAQFKSVKKILSLLSALVDDGTDRSSSIALAANAPHVLRGGAIAAASEVIDITNDIPASENASSARGPERISFVPLQLRDITSHTCLLNPAPIAGVIDGVSYEAAWTNGDGACGLHALFGDCNRGDLIRQYRDGNMGTAAAQNMLYSTNFTFHASEASVAC